MFGVRRIIGVVVLIIGILLAVLPFAGVISDGETIPPFAQGGSILVLDPSIYGSGTLHLSWSGGAATTVVSVYPCTDSSCSMAASLTPIAQGSGGSGTVSFSVTGGDGYAVSQTNNSGSLSATATIDGFSNLALIGVILAVVGIVLVILPQRARAAAPAESGDEAAAEEAPADEGIVAAAPEPAPTPPVGGTRPPIKCPHCGTMNEPWITNCRWCKRPLTSTQGPTSPP